MATPDLAALVAALSARLEAVEAAQFNERSAHALHSRDARDTAPLTQSAEVQTELSQAALVVLIVFECILYTWLICIK